MNDATVIQRVLALAAACDYDTWEILTVAKNALDFTPCNLTDADPPSHLLLLCKDSSILLITITTSSSDPTRDTWDMYSFTDPGLFETFLHDPLAERTLPPDALKNLLSSYSKFHLISTLEPGHA